MLNAVNIEAKQALALNQSITRESSLSQVLQIVFDSLKDAMPQSWVALAADVSEMLVVRLGLVPEAEKLFLSRKDLLERFISLRPQYALTMLRDLGKLNKTTFGPSVNLLVSSLQVDITNSMKLAASKGKTDATAAAAADQAASACAIPKPHKVALLIPGFDALQSLPVFDSECFHFLGGGVVVVVAFVVVDFCVVVISHQLSSHCHHIVYLVLAVLRS